MPSEPKSRFRLEESSSEEEPSRRGGLHEAVPPEDTLEADSSDDEDTEDEAEDNPPMGPCEVFVRVIKGEHLAAMDSNNVSDAFVELSFNGQSHKTKIIKGQQVPLWDEEFVFECDITPQFSLGTEPLILTAWDDDLFGDDLIGSYDLDLNLAWESKWSHNHEMYHQWLTLVDTTGNAKGTRGYLVINVAIVPEGRSRLTEHPIPAEEGSPENALEPVSFAMTTAQLYVDCYRAEALPGCDSDGCNDALVRISFAGEKSQTDVAETKENIAKVKVNNWEQRLGLPCGVPADPNNTHAFKAFVLLEIIDRDRSSKNDLIACHKLPLLDLCEVASQSNQSDVPNDPVWINLYGPPHTQDTGGWSAKRYHGVPKSCFRGRLLLRAMLDYDPIGSVPSVLEAQPLPRPLAKSTSIVRRREQKGGEPATPPPEITDPANAIARGGSGGGTDSHGNGQDAKLTLQCGGFGPGADIAGRKLPQRWVDLCPDPSSAAANAAAVDCALLAALGSDAIANAPSVVRGDAVTEEPLSTKVQVRAVVVGATDIPVHKNGVQANTQKQGPQMWAKVLDIVGDFPVEMALGRRSRLALPDAFLEVWVGTGDTDKSVSNTQHDQDGSVRVSFLLVPFAQIERCPLEEIFLQGGSVPLPSADIPGSVTGIAVHCISGSELPQRDTIDDTDYYARVALAKGAPEPNAIPRPSGSPAAELSSQEYGPLCSRETQVLSTAHSPKWDEWLCFAAYEHPSSGELVVPGLNADTLLVDIWDEEMDKDDPELVGRVFSGDHGVQLRKDNSSRFWVNHRPQNESADWQLVDGKTMNWPIFERRAKKTKWRQHKTGKVALALDTVSFVPSNVIECRRVGYQLRVHAFSARALPAADVDGHADPYLLAKIGGSAPQQTKPGSDCDPNWFATLIFNDIQLPDEDAQDGLAPQLTIEVWDKDKDKDKDDSLGSVRVDLATIRQLSDDMAAYHLSGDNNIVPKKWFNLRRRVSSVASGDKSQVLLSFELARFSPSGESKTCGDGAELDLGMSGVHRAWYGDSGGSVGDFTGDNGEPTGAFVTQKVRQAVASAAAGAGASFRVCKDILGDPRPKKTKSLCVELAELEPRQWLNSKEEEAGLTAFESGGAVLRCQPAMQACFVECLVVGCRDLPVKKKGGAVYLNISIGGALNQDVLGFEPQKTPKVSTHIHNPNFVDQGVRVFQGRLPLDPSFAPAVRFELLQSHAVSLKTPTKRARQKSLFSKALGHASADLEGFLPWVESNREAARLYNTGCTLEMEGRPYHGPGGTLQPWMQGRRVKADKGSTHEWDMSLEPRFAPAELETALNQCQAEQLESIQGLEWSYELKSKLGHSSMLSLPMGNSISRLKCYIRVIKRDEDCAAATAANNNNIADASQMTVATPMASGKVSSTASIDKEDESEPEPEREQSAGLEEADADGADERTGLVEYVNDVPSVAGKQSSAGRVGKKVVGLMQRGSKYKTLHETTVPAIMQEVLATRTHVVVRLYVTCAYLPLLTSDATMDTLHDVRKMGRKTWNWIEKKTGVDLDRDGDTGESQAVQHVGDGNYFKVFAGTSKNPLFTSPIVSGDPNKPQFECVFETDVFRLPGAGMLRVEVYNQNVVNSDTKVGVTWLDLEERFMSESWRALGRRFGAFTGGLSPKPLERRKLTLPESGSNRETGKLECWVDILTKEEATKFPRWEIAQPKPDTYAFRVIVWGARGMPAMDPLTRANDMYVASELTILEEGDRIPTTIQQETDTHWSAKDGEGHFNWRLVYDVPLPQVKPPRFILKVWDRDPLTFSSDLIGTADLSALVEQGLFRQAVQNHIDQQKQSEYLVSIADMSESKLRHNIAARRGEQLRMELQATQESGETDDDKVELLRAWVQRNDGLNEQAEGRVDEEQAGIGAFDNAAAAGDVGRCVQLIVDANHEELMRKADGSHWEELAAELRSLVMESAPPKSVRFPLPDSRTRRERHNMQRSQKEEASGAAALLGVRPRDLISTQYNRCCMCWRVRKCRTCMRRNMCCKLTWLVLGLFWRCIKMFLVCCGCRKKHPKPWPGRPLQTTWVDVALVDKCFEPDPAALQKEQDDALEVQSIASGNTTINGNLVDQINDYFRDMYKDELLQEEDFVHDGQDGHRSYLKRGRLTPVLKTLLDDTIDAAFAKAVEENQKRAASDPPTKLSHITAAHARAVKHASAKTYRKGRKLATAVHALKLERPELEVSLELVLKKNATEVGKGREEPNVQPELVAPKRIDFNPLNPFAQLNAMFPAEWIEQLKKIMCCVMTVACCMILPIIVLQILPLLE